MKNLIFIIKIFVSAISLILISIATVYSVFMILSFLFPFNEKGENFGLTIFLVILASFATFFIALFFHDDKSNQKDI